MSAAGTVSGVSKQETASLDCQVDADPSNEVHFWWTFLGTPMKSKRGKKQNKTKKNQIIATIAHCFVIAPHCPTDGKQAVMNNGKQKGVST